MKTQTQFNFNSRKGLHKVSEHLYRLSEDPAATTQNERHAIGHLRIMPSALSLAAAAAALKSKANALSRSAPKWQGPTRTAPLPIFAPDGTEVTGVLALDAVRVCGSPEAARDTIQRQLAIQGAGMDPAAVRRAKRAVSQIESYLRAKALRDLQAASDQALADKLNAGVRPKKTTCVPAGAKVFVEVNRVRFLGIVLASRINGFGIATHDIERTHIYEWRGGRLRLYPTPPVKFPGITSHDFRVVEK